MPEDDSDFLGAIKIRILAYPPPAKGGGKELEYGDNWC
jgi:hypothetical protein